MNESIAAVKVRVRNEFRSILVFDCSDDLELRVGQDSLAEGLQSAIRNSLLVDQEELEID